MKSDSCDVTDDAEALAIVPDMRAVRLCGFIARCGGGFAALMGAIGLIGWITGIERLVALSRGNIAMKTNAAVCLLLAGTAVLLLAMRPSRRRTVVARGLAIFVMLVGSLTVLEHATHRNFGIDELLFREAPGAIATTSPNRMGVPASVSFTLGGVALLLLSTRRPRAWAVGQLLGVAIGLIVLMPLIGYVYNIHPLYGVARVNAIAMHTAMALVALSLALMGLRPTSGPMAFICADDAGGMMARRLIGPAVLLPFFLGWLKTVSERAGWFDPAVGRPIVVVSFIVCFSILVWLNARAMSRLGRRQAAVQRRARNSEERLRLGLEAGRTGTWDWDIQRNHVTWSDRIYEFHDLRPGQYDGTLEGFTRLVHPDDVDRVGAEVRQAIEHKTIYQTEFRVIRPGGEVRWLSTTGEVRYAEDGKPLRMLGATTDITRRKEAESQRDALLESERAARIESERANRVKDEFLATLSHELRTPMNAILGWSQLLRARERSAEDVAEGLAIIERNARVQTQLIDDLLDMSRIISGKIRLDVQRVDLQIVIEAGIEALLHAAQAKEIRIEKALDLPHGVCVSGDPGRLQQIVWNLVSNAVKFTPRGGFVGVSLRRAESRVEIVVSDTGQGIKPEFLTSVFDRFRQADASTTRQHAGLGLGLAIVRHLTELHGGKVRVHSDGDGRGATFTIELPVHTPLTLPDANADGDSDDNRSAAVRAGATGALAGSTLQGVKVLVVDDEPDARVLVKRLLEECDAIVITADSVAEGLAAIARDTPHVLVSDIGMPGQDGYDLVRQVRAMAHDHAAKVPAIALTAFARSEDRTRAMMAGFDMHVAKPVEPAELLAVVARLAGRAG